MSGVLGPLLLNPRIQFVKGFYRRPLKVGEKVQAGGGGRVTELTARPLLNLFYPELSGVVQPLSGEYAGRRAALEQAPFFSGYGVETGLLLHVFARSGQDEETIKRASAAVNEVIRNSTDCEVAKPLLVEAYRGIEDARTEVRAPASQQTLNALQVQVDRVKEVCP